MHSIMLRSQIIHLCWESQGIVNIKRFKLWCQPCVLGSWYSNSLASKYKVFLPRSPSGWAARKQWRRDAVGGKVCSKREEQRKLLHEWYMKVSGTYCNVYVVTPLQVINSVQTFFEEIYYDSSSVCMGLYMSWTNSIILYWLGLPQVIKIVMQYSTIWWM